MTVAETIETSRTVLVVDDDAWLCDTLKALLPAHGWSPVVAASAARGLTYDQVGLVLGISANTVRSYIRTIYEKLAVGSRTEAVLVAMRLGLVPDEARPLSV